MTTSDSSPDDPVIRREEEAAAREAARIGGARPEYEDEEGRAVSERDRALIEGGEGVEEGFEVAENDLRETASHGENRYAPQEHDFGQEESAGVGDAVSGEPDQIDVTETVRDPDADVDEDPGEGPGISHDR
ncbi:MAG: hypothetical protein QOI32_1202 [Thermoleophilaceae bacterium]|jgi:hypothetical protein|nr:hypothetical protein [Thermoleophilaceae bacterium]